MPLPGLHRSLQEMAGGPLSANPLAVLKYLSSGVFFWSNQRAIAMGDQLRHHAQSGLMEVILRKTFRYAEVAQSEAR